jgi:hypothetical protein
MNKLTKDKIEIQAARMLECANNLDAEGRRAAIQSGLVEARFFKGRAPRVIEHGLCSQSIHEFFSRSKAFI